MVMATMYENQNFNWISDFRVPRRIQGQDLHYERR